MENMTTQKLYESKESGYFRQVRKDVLDAIPLSNREGDLLEIGAGECRTLIFAKEKRYAKAVYGIELVECELDSSTRALLDGLVIGDIQVLENPFGDTLFDVILCPDVLEHLVDPYSVIRKMRTWLKPGGVVVASLPNINHWRTLFKIVVEDSFSYEDKGILDYTHLRFFAGKDVRRLFSEIGYQIVEVKSNPGGGRGKMLLAISGGVLRRFLTYQYIVVARQVQENE